MTPISVWDWFFSALFFFAVLFAFLWVIFKALRTVGLFIGAWKRADEAAGFVQVEYERREKLERRHGAK